jgi:cytoskeletal protein RodZ
LIKYASAIGRLVSSGQAHDMEDALHAQRKFWKLVGVLMIVMMVLGIVGVIAAIAIPAVMMAKGGLG